MDIVNFNLVPMEAKSVSVLPKGNTWRYEPKWDGFRCLAYKIRDQVILRSKSGKPLERYFPDVVEKLKKIKVEQFILDGEIVIPTEDGYSFSELQLRLHPAASRVKKLADEHPAHFIIFDILKSADGKNLLGKPLSVRRKELDRFFKNYIPMEKHLILSPQTESLDTAKEWIKEWGRQIDGLIAKNSTDPYLPAERQMQKYKFIRTADCVVGGFRYGTNSTYVGSLLLGLYDDAGLLNHVGFTSSLSNEDKPGLTKKLKKLIEQPGFTGKAPGAPSRWTTERSTKWEPLKPELVVEVAYDHVTDERFRHGTRLIRWRPDKSPRQCTMIQLKQPKVLNL
jgi:ATP-dependent DNA ligase